MNCIYPCINLYSDSNVEPYDRGSQRCRTVSLDTSYTTSLLMWWRVLPYMTIDRWLLLLFIAPARWTLHRRRDRSSTAHPHAPSVGQSQSIPRCSPATRHIPPHDSVSSVRQRRVRSLYVQHIEISVLVLTHFCSMFSNTPVASRSVLDVCVIDVTDVKCCPIIARMESVVGFSSLVAERRKTSDFLENEVFVGQNPVVSFGGCMYAPHAIVSLQEIIRSISNGILSISSFYHLQFTWSTIWTKLSTTWQQSLCMTGKRTVRWERWPTRNTDWLWQRHIYPVKRWSRFHISVFTY